jgi:hypothetical protein
MLLLLGVENQNAFGLPPIELDSHIVKMGQLIQK